jgi:hypothetical protein
LKILTLRPNPRPSSRISFLNPASRTFRTHSQTALQARPHHFPALTCQSTPVSTVCSNFPPIPISNLRGVANAQLSPRPPARIMSDNPCSTSHHQQPTFARSLSLSLPRALSRSVNLPTTHARLLSTITQPNPCLLLRILALHRRTILSLAQHLVLASRLDPDLRQVSHVLRALPNQSRADRVAPQTREPNQNKRRLFICPPRCADRQSSLAADIISVEPLVLPTHNLVDPRHLISWKTTRRSAQHKRLSLGGRNPSVHLLLPTNDISDTHYRDMDANQSPQLGTSMGTSVMS